MIPATKAAQFRLPGEVTNLFTFHTLAGYDKTLHRIFNKLSDTLFCPIIVLIWRSLLLLLGFDAMIAGDYSFVFILKTQLCMPVYHTLIKEQSALVPANSRVMSTAIAKLKLIISAPNVCMHTALNDNKENWRKFVRCVITNKQTNLDMMIYDYITTIFARLTLILGNWYKSVNDGIILK